MNKKSFSYKKFHKKWSDIHKKQQKKLLDTHKEALTHLSNNSKQYALSALGGLMLLTTPVNLQLESGDPKVHYEKVNKNLFLVSDLENLVPQEFRYFTDEENEKIAKKLSEFYDMDIKYEIDNKRLNTTYGYIGAEQHLMRYPGDTESTHFQTNEEAEEFMSSGLAPGRGAWGYFANSREAMTQEDIEREKYYIAVQTFLAPDYLNRVGEYRDFFKFRKMLLVNPHNGRGIVVVVGDAGPAQWTKKHLGGSPEVMRYLERYDGRQKGPVLYYFINDPENKIPLGPIE
jgi:hypothetical protein